MIPSRLQGLLYRWLLWLLAPALLWKARAQDPGRWRERLAVYPQAPAPDTRPIWVHAASLGEAKAAALLIRELRSQGYDGPFVATTTTATGAEAIATVLERQDRHLYAPYDLPSVVRSALRQLNPRLLVVMEVEIWPNLWAACDHRQIPIVLANARLSEASMQRYRRLLPGLIRQTLQRASLILAQTQPIKARYLELGAKADAVQVTGNLKYSLEITDGVRQQGARLRELLGRRPVWLAASTHEGEEEIALHCHRQLLKTHPDALLVLVPRHPQRFDGVAELCQQSSLTTQRRSENATAEVDQATRVYLADTLGELLGFYCAADLTWVAGSFSDVGGHNILEPAACGCPILVGPDMANFAEICQEFLQHQALIQVETPEQLAEQVTRLLTQPEGGQQMAHKALTLTTPYSQASHTQAAALMQLLSTGSKT